MARESAEYDRDWRSSARRIQSTPCLSEHRLLIIAWCPQQAV
jgi:hypothetical protein